MAKCERRDEYYRGDSNMRLPQKTRDFNGSSLAIAGKRGGNNLDPWAGMANQQIVYEAHPSPSR
jgi:hypothetical protein